MDCLISLGDFSVDGVVDSRITIMSFLLNSGSNCIISRIYFIRDLAINFRRRRIGCEFRIYVSTCCRNSASYSSIDIRLIRLAVKRSHVRFLCQFGVHIRLCIDICRIGFQSQFCLRSFRINFLCNSSCIISYLGSVCRDFLPMIRCRSLQSCDIVFVRSDIACFEGFDLIINLSLGIEMGQRVVYI